MTATAAEKLLAIAEEIEAHPERWCQGPQALSAIGETVEARSRKACAWCAMGFLRREGLWEVRGVADTSLDAAAQEDGEANFITFNETPGRTASEVAALFRKASLLAAESAK